MLKYNDLTDSVILVNVSHHNVELKAAVLFGSVRTKRTLQHRFFTTLAFVVAETRLVTVRLAAVLTGENSTTLPIWCTWN